MRIDSPKMTNAEATGSFKGSFSGSFEGDIQADSVQYANVLSKPTLLSGSAQIASDISGSFDSLSGSLASRITTHESNNTVDVTLNTSGGPDYLSISGQEITLGTIDLSADTNFAVSDTTGQTGVDLTLTDDTLSATLAGLDTTDSPTFAALTINGAITVSGNVDGRDVSADGSKLDGIEANATADQTAAEIKTAYESNSDTNAFTDTLLSKLNNIEATADVTDTDNVTSAGALMDSEVNSLSGIKTLTVPDSTTISSFGASLVDDADASAARTTLGVDQAGTDNSTDVTLVTTSHDYLSLSGQAITLGQIDISDDTNLAVSDTTGQTGINLTLSGDTLSGVVSGLGTSSDVQFNNLTVAGNLTVTGDTSTISTTDLIVEDHLITINHGGTTAASANGAGLFISGANESITWDNGNSRFNFSDDVHAAGNITLTGTVDGRDVAADGSKLDNIEANADVTDTANVTAAGALMDSEVDADIKTLSLPANTTITSFAQTFLDDTSAAAVRTTLGVDSAGTVNYTHPTHPGDDFSIDTGALTGATVISDLDINLTTDTLGHVTDANATVATRTLTLANLGYTGATDANNYSHPTYAGDDISIDTGALTGATVISDLDFNVTTDTLGHVTDANATVSTRSLTAANLSLGTSNHVQFHCLGIGTAASTVAGEIRATGDITAYYSSDERLKDNIVQLGGALDKVNQLRGVSFDWKEAPEVHSHEGNDIGVIAQEVEAVYPELVHERENGYKAVDYVKLTAVLIEAVKELSAKVEALENK